MISSCEVLQSQVRSGPLEVDLRFPYHPHVTVAHDLDKDALDRAYDALSEYDCAFDVVIVPKLPLLRSLKEFPRLMRGAHVDDPEVRVARARVVEAEQHAEVWVEADGELLGQLPARVELLEGAITLCGVPD